MLSRSSTFLPKAKYSTLEMLSHSSSYLIHTIYSTHIYGVSTMSQALSFPFSDLESHAQKKKRLNSFKVAETGFESFSL